MTDISSSKMNLSLFNSERDLVTIIVAIENMVNKINRLEQTIQQRLQTEEQDEQVYDESQSHESRSHEFSDEGESYKNVLDDKIHEEEKNHHNSQKEEIISKNEVLSNCLLKENAKASPSVSEYKDKVKRINHILSLEIDEILKKQTQKLPESDSQKLVEEQKGAEDEWQSFTINE